jgi:L-serine dehydratase
MKAAGMFARGLADDGLMPQVATVRVALYGSLGLTGPGHGSDKPGHGSDKAVLLGLEGEQPASSRPCCTTTTGSCPARPRTAWRASC